MLQDIVPEGHTSSLMKYEEFKKFISPYAVDTQTYKQCCDKLAPIIRGTASSKDIIVLGFFKVKANYTCVFMSDMRKDLPKTSRLSYLIYYGYYFIEENDIHNFSVIISGPDIIL